MNHMIYLDANIFIYATINNEEKGENARKLIRDLIKQKEQLCTSTLTWDEVVYTIWKKRGKEIALIEGEKFLNFPNMDFIDAKKEIISDAQDIMKNHHLKPRDAIHVATALLNKCSEIISDDSDFDKINQLKRRKI